MWELAWAPAESTLTRVVAPVWQSCTNTSENPLVSPGTRLAESLRNATNRPSAEIEGDTPPASPSTPAESTLTRVVSAF